MIARHDYVTDIQWLLSDSCIHIFIFIFTTFIFHAGVRDIVPQIEGDTTLPMTIQDGGSQKPSPEPCPYAWIQHPEQLLHEHVWLLLATLFLSLRVLFWVVPLVSKQVVRMRTIATR